MTPSDWARVVDAAVVSAARSLKYALRGKSAIAIFQGEGVPDTAFEEATWTNQGRFVSVHSLGDDRQLRALFMPPILGSDSYETPEQQRERAIREMHYERFYDRTNDGAQRAAEDIVAYLTFADFKKPAGDGL